MINRNIFKRTKQTDKLAKELSAQHKNPYHWVKLLIQNSMEKSKDDNDRYSETKQNKKGS